MRWSIDAGDAYSVAKVRRAVIAQLQKITGNNTDLFTLETVLGELLGAEMARGHVALAIIIERGVGGPLLHIYTQGPSDIRTTQGELRDAILSGARVPMSVEVTAQGTHYCLRVQMGHEAAVERSVLEVVREAD